MASDAMGANADNVEDTLKQRGNVYGNYKEVLVARDQIMEILKLRHLNTKNSKMPGHLEVGFGDLVLKLVRSAGAPEYSDSFHDLGGYAKLMEDLADE